MSTWSPYWVNLTGLCLAPAPDARETALDRRVNIPDSLARAVPPVAPLCDELPGLTRMPVCADGVSLHCELEGDGPPLVLVSGGPGCTHHHFHPHLSRAAEFCRLVYYDQRGTGLSQHDASGASYTIRQAVADLETLRRALGVDRWFVLGHSYGGFLAQCYALEHPGRLTGLILVCALPGLPKAHMLPTRQLDLISERERDAIRAVGGDASLTSEEYLFNKELAGDWKRQNFCRPSEEDAARMALYGWRPAPGFRESVCPEIAAVDLAGRFDDWTVPTLLLEARWDLTWNTDKPALMQAHHPHARLVLLEDAGHSPFADVPEVFSAALRTFINQAFGHPSALPLDAPGRMTWPPAVIGEVARLPYTGACERALLLLADMAREGTDDAGAWFSLGLRIYDGHCYDEALRCFQRSADLSETASPGAFKALVWQGIVLDLTDRREEALDVYGLALATEDPGTVRHDQYGLQIDRDWVLGRLSTPFARGDP